MNAFDYINATYDLAAKKGSRVEYTGEGDPKMGTVTGVEGAHLLIKLDGGKHSLPYHPTWKLRIVGDA